MAIVSMGISASHKSIDLSNIQKGTFTYKLTNGLTVILREDHSSELTAIHLRVNTGSIDEYDRFGAGLTHFFEHSVFLGSKKFPKKDSYSSEIESFGGANVNAYTTYDHTAYHFSVLSRYTKEALSAIEDLVFHPLFPKKDVKNEMGSILSEMDMRNDQVESFFSTFTSSFLFKNLPYKYPIIGYPERFKECTREELLKYYSDRYVPNNMILSVVGDFNATELLKSIDTIFGPNPSKPVQKFSFQEEEPYQQETAQTTHPKAKFTRFSLNWKTVSYYSQDMYPLDVLASFLGSGRGSILFDKIKEEMGLAQEISAFSWTPKNDGIFEIGVSLPIIEDKAKTIETIEAIKKATFQILEEVASGKIEQYRLDTVKREVLTGFVGGKESALGLARSLAGSVMTTGGINYDSIYLKGIEEVSIADVVAVTKKYLLSTPYKTVILVPPALQAQGNLYENSLTEENFDKKDVPLLPYEEKKKFDGVIGLPVDRLQVEKEIEKFEASQAGVSSKHQKIVLKNGLTVVYYQNEKLPRVSIALAANGGLFDEEDIYANGSFNLLSSMFLTSNDKFSKEELVRKLKRNAIIFSPFAMKNSFGFITTYLNDIHQEGSEILFSVLENKTFNKDDFEIEKKDALFALHQNKENGWHQSSLLFRKFFFEGTPYVRSVEGTLESVEKVTPEMLMAIKTRFMVPSNMVICIYGALTYQELDTYYLKKLEALPTSVPPKINYQPVTLQPLAYKEIYKDSHAGRQSFFRMGFRAPALFEADEPPFRVLSGYLSGMGGPLFKLRSENYKGGGGRAYQLGSFYDSSRDYGAMVFYAALRYEAREEYDWAIKSFLKEALALTKKKLSAEEIDRAKNRIIGDETISNERLDARVLNEALFELFGFGYDAFFENIKKIEGVDNKSVKRVAAKYLNKNNFAAQVLLPEEVVPPVNSATKK